MSGRRLFGRVEELDQRIKERWRISERSRILRRSAAVLAHSGDSLVWCALLVFLWLFADRRWRVNALQFGAGILATAAIVMAVKLIVRRQRPEGNWGSVYRRLDPFSFPSGHTARAFMLIAVSGAVGPWWLFVLLLFWGPLLSASRVGLGVHYLSDVVGGAVLGVCVGLLVNGILPR